MYQRIELENSMLMPTVHDPRYDELYFDEEEEEEREEPKFMIGDIVTDGTVTLKVTDKPYWDSWEEDYSYGAEPLTECDYAWTEIFEHEMTRK